MLTKSYTEFQIPEPVPEALITLNEQERFVYVNQVAGDMLKRKPEDLLGKHIWTEFPEAAGQPIHEAYKKALKTRLHVYMEEFNSVQNRWFGNHLFQTPGGISIYFRDITEQKKTEEKYREQNHVLRNLIESISNAVFSVDRNCCYTSFNKVHSDTMKAIYGKEIQFGGCLFDYQTADDASMARLNLERALKGEMFSVEVYAGDAVYSRIYSEVFYKPVYNSEGKVTGISVEAKDITERKQAEDALRESEALYRSVLNASPDDITITDLKGNILMISPSAKTMFGYKQEEEIQDRILTDFVVEEDRKRVFENIGLQHKGFDVSPREYKGLRKDGSTFPIEVKTDFIRDMNDQPVKIVIIVRDITERKKTEEALQSAHKSYFDIFNSSSEAIYILDETGTFIDVNKGAEEMYLYSREELIGQSPASVAAPGLNDLVEILRLLQTVRTTGIAVRFDFWAVRKNGEVFPKEVIVNRGIYFEKNVLIATARDITDRKKAENIIRTSEERYKSIIAASPDGVAITDLEGRILMASPVLAQMFGFKKEEELAGQLITDYILPEDRQSAVNNIALMFQGVITGLSEYRAIRKDGTLFNLEVNAEFIRDEEGDPLQMVFIIRDITLRKHVEEQLKESERFLNETQQVSGIGSYKLDIVNGKWDCSKELDNLFGTQPNKKKIIDYWVSIIQEDHRQMMKDYFEQEVIGNKQRFDKEYKIVNQITGNEYWVHGIGELVFDVNGNPVEMLGTIQDITEKKEAEEILYAKEKLFRSLIENSNDGMVILDGRGNIKYVAPSVKSVLGYNEEELLNTSLLSIGHPDELEHLREIYKKILSTTGFQASEYVPRIKHKDGTWRWIAGSFNNLLNDPVISGVIGNFRDVTEKVTAEQAIRESEIKYHSLIDNAADAIAIYNAAGIILDVNTTGLAMLGYTKEEVLQMKVTDFFLEEEMQSIPMTYNKLKPGESTLRQRNFKRKGGGFVLTEVRSQVLPDGNLLSIIRDLTERMEIQEKLRISNDNYSGLVNTIEGIVWEADAKTLQFSFVSKQAELILGYPAEQWITEKDFWANHLHEADREWAVSYCVTCTNEKKSHDFEYRMIAADGKIVWLRDIVTVILENDKPVKLRGIMINVTERKIIEKGLEDYKFALNQSSIVDVSDSTGAIQYVNENFSGISGYSLEELKGKDHRILKSGYHSQKHYENLWNTVTGGNVWRSEVKNRAKDGSFYWVDTTIVPFLDEEGKPFQFIAIRSDITKRKEAEAQILNALERYDILSKATSDTIWDWDVPNNVIIYNQGITKNFGYKQTRIKNVKEWWDLNIHPEDRGKVHEAFEKAFQKRKTVVQVEYRYRSAGGNYKHIFDRAFIIYGANKKPERMIGSMQDITTEKEIAIRIEKEVIVAQEREWNQIGMELHDNVNQILAASMLLMGLGKEKMERGENAVSIISESEKHVGEAIAEIRRLSHQLAPVSVDNLSLEQVFESLFETVNANKQIKIKLQMKGMKEIYIPQKLQINLYRILQEQLNNIVKYAKASEVIVSFKKVKHSFVFKIVDNGIGFDPGSQSNGIGLENIKRRAKAFSGEYRLNTAPSKGCEVVVEIPLATV